jgi:hypothetical protein
MKLNKDYENIYKDIGTVIILPFIFMGMIICDLLGGDEE